jgi:hypothetical protein
MTIRNRKQKGLYEIKKEWLISNLFKSLKAVTILNSNVAIVFRIVSHCFQNIIKNVVLKSSQRIVSQ